MLHAMHFTPALRVFFLHKKYRISHAKELLRFGSESIEEISYQCGFNSAAYFIRMFKQMESLTPHEFRQDWKERTTD